VENASYGLTVCAERVAIWKAVSEGAQDLVALALVTSSGVTPCGACRQVMSEFNQDLQVIVADTHGNAWRTTLKHLLPEAFLPTGLSQEESEPST
jgi:cytidine deaminase